MKRTPLQRKTPLKSGSRLSRSTPMEQKTPMRKVNRERLDKRTKAYRAYMQSAAWEGRRQVALQQARYRCARCGWCPFPDGGTQSVEAMLDAHGLHVHHTTYARFGNENVEDLEVVCEPCHRKEHASRFIRPRGLRGGR